jgi:hypothetical protein
MRKAISGTREIVVKSDLMRKALSGTQGIRGEVTWEWQQHVRKSVTARSCLRRAEHFHSRR